MSKYRIAESWNEQTFALPPGHIEVSLFPELVTLAEVAAEVVLVLHHILGGIRFSILTFWLTVTMWIEGGPVSVYLYFYW